MNKTSLKICFVIALSLSAATVYAASTSITSSITMGGGSFSPSNKVTINVDSNGTVYQAYSFHSSGDREIAANSTDPKMYFKTTSAIESPTAGSFTATSWTSL